MCQIWRLGLFLPLSAHQQLSHLRGGGILHVGQQLGVHIQGERGARMPEHLRHGFRLNPGGECERRGRVTQVVEPESVGNFAAFNTRMKSCCVTLRSSRGPPVRVVKISPLSAQRSFASTRATSNSLRHLGCPSTLDPRMEACVASQHRQKDQGRRQLEAAVNPA